MNKEGIAFSAPSAKPAAGTLVPNKGNAKAGDPTAMGTKANRQNVPASSADRNGAAYSIKASYMKMTDPAAGQTQANGKVVKTAVNRDRFNFDSGAGASY
jgi:hypothetical protein